VADSLFELTCISTGVHQQAIRRGIDIIDQLVEKVEFLDMVSRECKKLPPVESFEEVLASFDFVVLLEGIPESQSQTTASKLLRR